MLAELWKKKRYSSRGLRRRAGLPAIRHSLSRQTSGTCSRSIVEEEFIPSWYGARLTVRMSSFPNTPFFRASRHQTPTRASDESVDAHYFGSLPAHSDQNNRLKTVSLCRALTTPTQGYGPAIFQEKKFSPPREVRNIGRVICVKRSMLSSCIEYIAQDAAILRGSGIWVGGGQLSRKSHY